MPMKINLLELVILIMLAADVISDIAMWVHNQ
jgi:hypothetical protein